MTVPSAAAVTGTRGAGEGGDDGVDLVVGADRVVVEQQHGLGAGQLRRGAPGSRRRVAPRHPRRAAPRRCAARRGSSRSTPAASASAVSWYGPQPSGPGPRAAGPWSEQVGDRRATVGRPGSRRCGRPCGGSRGPAPRTRRAWCSPGSRLSKVHAPRRPSGPIGKCGGDMARRSTSMAGVAVVLVAGCTLDLGAVVVDGARERQPLGVVPVEVAEQQRPAERAARRAARRGRRSPVPASSTRVGAASSSARAATHEVLPP